MNSPQELKSCPLDSHLIALPTRTLQDVQYMKQAAIAAVTRDLKDFCEWNRMDRAALTGSNKPAETAKEVSQRYRAAKMKNKIAAENLLMSPELADNVTDPWQRSMLGSKQLKNAIPRTLLVDSKTRLKPEQLIETFSRTIPENAHFDVPNFEPDPRNHDLSKVASLGGCVYFTPSATECASAVQQTYDFLKVHHVTGFPVTGVAVFKEVLGKDYAEGLKNAAVKLWTRVKNQDAPPSSNIFSDLKESFTASGINPKQADDMTWQVMAVLAASGPNVLPRYMYNFNFKLDKWPGGLNPNIAPLQAIAEAIVDLDTIKMDQRPPSLYSLPPNVKFPCDSGKSYYFWMSAYLSRMMIKKGFTSSSARGAAFLAALGYSIGQGNTSGRDKDKLLTDKRYGSTENGLRIDLSLASAGALFGADAMSGPQKSYDVESAFRSYMEHGGDLPPNQNVMNWMPYPAQAARWMSNINPKFIFDAF